MSCLEDTRQKLSDYAPDSRNDTPAEKECEREHVVDQKMIQNLQGKRYVTTMCLIHNIFYLP